MPDVGTLANGALFIVMPPLLGKKLESFPGGRRKEIPSGAYLVRI